jgi:hypothetical protein
VALGDEGWAPFLDAAGDVGVEVDPKVAEIVHVEELVLWQAAANAARMLHEDAMPAQTPSRTCRSGPSSLPNGRGRA